MYYEKLIKKGIAVQHVLSIHSAFGHLYSALRELSSEDLEKLTRGNGLLGNLREYCKSIPTERNIADEIYAASLDRARRHIDPMEFAAFSDDLFPMAEQAAEVELPGASMLCKSLIDIRREHERDYARNLPLMTRVSALALLDRVKDAESGALSIRLTDKFVGSCRDMDDWQNVGSYVELGRRDHNNGDDSRAYENGTYTMMLQVEATGDVKKAIHDTFSYHGCAHEHDCCGCISQAVCRVRALPNGVYVVVIGWSRNC